MTRAFAVLIALILSGCSHPTGDASVTEWTPMWAQDEASEEELEQRLQKLNDAKHELAVQKAKVEVLKDAYYKLQLQIISKRVKTFERRLSQLQVNKEAYSELLRYRLPRLFAEEREALIDLIDNDEALAKQGQGLLDKILRIITQLNEDKQAMLP